MQNQVITELQDFRRLEWSRIRHSSGTAGSFLKSKENIRGIKWYYKLSDFDAYNGIIGHECVNELIADRLLTLLGIPHLNYQLIHARIQIQNRDYITWLCRSKDYKKPDEGKIALDTFYQMERQEMESPLDFCVRQGWSKYIYQMLITDFLILNRDRHGANIEVLRSRLERTYRLSPLFDHGLSLYFSAHDKKDLEGADPMADKRVQCFVGSGSTYQNLKLIPKAYLQVKGKLRETDRDYLFKDLEDALSPAYRDAIWEMIWRRWQHYESLCNS